MEKVYSIGALLLLPVLDALSGVLLRPSPLTHDWITQLFLRLLVATSLALVLFPRVPAHFSAREWWLVSGRVLVGWFLGLVLWITACKETTLARAAIFSSLPLAPFWGRIILGQALTVQSCVRLLVASIGVWIMSGKGLGELGASLNRGDLCALGTSACIGFSGALSRLHHGQISGAVLARVSLLATTPLFGIWAILRGAPLHPECSLTEGLLMFSSGTQILLSCWIWQYVVRRHPLVRVSNIAALEPACAALAAAAFFAEPISASVMWGGGLVILAAVQFPRSLRGYSRAGLKREALNPIRTPLSCKAGLDG